MKNNKKLSASAIPFIRQGDSERTIMLDVIIALIPMLVWAVYIFGYRALTVVAVSVLSSVIFELIFCKLTKQPVSGLGLSAVVTGMLFAYTLPVGISLWVVVIGAFIAIVPAKNLLALFDKNIINPALSARLILSLIMPAQMKGYVQPSGAKLSAFSVNCTDIVAGATPIEFIKESNAPDIGIFDLFIGNTAGCIGEVSALLILIGGLYLLLRRVITWHVPVSFLGTFAVLSFLYPRTQSVQAYEYTLIALCTGGLMLGAVFMATDYSSSPVTGSGRIIYGVGCGVIALCVRNFTSMAEGTAVAILIMNLLSRPLDMLTRPKPFGYTKKAKS